MGAIILNFHFLKPVKVGVGKAGDNGIWRQILSREESSKDKEVSF